jgi:hypothetical protein
MLQKCASKDKDLAMWYAGIDRADTRHDVVVIDEAGRKVAPQRGEHSPEGLNTSLKHISRRVHVSCGLDFLGALQPFGCQHSCLKCFVTMRNVLEQGQKSLRGCFTGEAGGSIIL